MFTCNGNNSLIINTHLGTDDVVFCTGTCEQCTVQIHETAHICRNCKHYAEYEGVCCCYKSEHVADFTSPDDECRCWRKKEDA